MSEMRDVGPYEDRQQVLDQFSNWARGLLQSMSDMAAAELLLAEAAMATGVRPSDLERQYVEGYLDPMTAIVLHGWLMRAYMAGRKAQRDQMIDEVHAAIDTAMRGSGYQPPAPSGA